MWEESGCQAAKRQASRFSRCSMVDEGGVWWMTVIGIWPWRISKAGGSFEVFTPGVFFGSWLKLCCFFDFDRTWPIGCNSLMILPECYNDKLLGLEVCSTGPTVVHLDKEAPSKVQWPIVPSLVMVLVSKWSDASALGMRSHSSGTGNLLETWSDACRMPSMLLWGKACSRLDSPVSLWGMLTDVSFEVFDAEGGSNSHLKQDKDSAFDDSLKPSFSITWWLVATSSQVSLQCMNHEINTR